MQIMFDEGKYPFNDDFGPSTKTKLIPKLTISDNTGEIFCCEYSPDGQYIAAGCGDGAIRVFNTHTGILSHNLQGGSNVALPTTALKFRPNDLTGVSRAKNVLLAANAAGAVQHWHMSSGKCLHSYEDADNQVYALDYNSDGSLFVTGGKDTIIRIYDESTKKEIQSMKGGSGYGTKASPGHSNRVFCCKFKPDDQNLILSGGWDNTVQIWDLREGRAVRSFFGPHLCGNSLDICGNEILTGSWRTENQLEIWDFSTGKRLSGIQWGGSSFTSAGQQTCMVYAAQFSKEGQGKYIVAGGSGSNEAKVFDHKNDNIVLGTVTGLTRGVFTADFSPDNEHVAIAGGDASIRILKIGKEKLNT